MHRLKVVFLTALAIVATCLVVQAADSPEWLTRPGTIANAIAQPDGTAVYLDAVIVDKIDAHHNPGYFVIQEFWGDSRIVVNLAPPQSLRKRQLVDVEGVIGTLENGERAILSPRVIGYFDDNGNLIQHMAVAKGLESAIAWPNMAELLSDSQPESGEQPNFSDITAASLPEPKLHKTISELLNNNPPGLNDGNAVRLGMKKVVATGTNPKYGKFFVIADDTMCAGLSDVVVYSSQDLTVGSRVNDLVAQVQSDGDTTVLATDEGPGFDPQTYAGEAQATAAGTIGFARTLVDGTLISMEGKVVIADTSDFGGKIYIIEPDFSAAMLVTYGGTAQFSRGGVINITGTLCTADNGERAIAAGTDGISVVSESGTEVSPVIMTDKIIGGGAFNDFTPGITFPETAAGLYNKGMLVKVYGTVTAVDQAARAFYVDDGSNLKDQAGNIGIKVVWNTDGQAKAVPSVGDFVTNIIGISSSEALNPGEYSRVVLLRKVPTPVVTVQASSHKVDLSWSTKNGISYNIYRSDSETGPFVLLTTVTDGQYCDTAIQNGSTYYYEVSGTECGVEGACSEPVTATPMGSMPIVELTSFDPATETYIYTVTLAADNTYDFGYLQVDTQVANAAPHGPWTIVGPIVTGVDQVWPHGSIQWDAVNTEYSAIWDAATRAQEIPSDTAWQGRFMLVVPHSEPVMGQAATKDGQAGSYKIHDVLVPGPKPIEPPVTEISFDGTKGNDDWFTSVVKVTLKATDPEGDDAIDTTEYKLDDADWKDYTDIFQVTDDGQYRIQARSEDIYGTVETPQEPKSIKTLKIDATAPVVTGTLVTQPNANGWYNQNVQIKYTASDATSGLAEPALCDANITTAFTQTISTEGSNLSDTGKAKDKAGNGGSCVISGIKIDKTAPVITVIKAPIGNCHLISYETAIVQFRVTDGGSGVSGVPEVVADIVPVDGWADAINNQPVTVTKICGTADCYQAKLPLEVPGQYVIRINAKDNAGNISQCPTPITFGARGFEVEWEAPLATMDTYEMQDGSTLPVKFKLKDPAKNDAYVNKYNYTVKVYYNSPIQGKVLKESYTPDYDCCSHCYQVNMQTRDKDGRTWNDWDCGDYTIVIVGPGIWDIITGPYKSAYGVEIVDKGCAKGKGRRQDWDWDWFWRSCGGQIDWCGLIDCSDLYNRNDLYCWSH